MVEPALLMALLVTGNTLSSFFAGTFPAAIAATVHIPIIGVVFKFFLYRPPLKFIGIIRLIAWAISSSGLLFGYGLYYWIWGTPKQPSEFWVLLIFSAVNLSNIFTQIAMFELANIRQVLAFAYQSMPWEKENLDAARKIEGARKSMVLACFADVHLPQFLRLLVSIGLVFFSLGHLNLVELVHDTPPTIWEALNIAISLIDITKDTNEIYKGVTWEVIRSIAAFLVFFWVVMFVSLASSTVNADELIEPVKTDSKNGSSV